jgi:hypothetical protein
VPEDETSTLGGFLSTLAGKKSSADGVRKDADGKVSPTLKPEEIARYEKIFGIMKKVVNPGPEVGGAERTNTEKVASKAAMEKVAGKSGGGDSDGMFGTIAKMGLLAGLIGAALTSMSEELVDKIKGFTKDIVDFADSTGDEFGKLGGLALKIGAKIGLKGLKMIPFLGSFVNFYYAKKHFDNEEYFDGVYELISGVAGFFPGPGTIISMVMDGYKIYAEIEANKREQETGEKPSFSDILGEQAMKLATFVGNAIKDGKVPILSTLFKFGEGIGYFITGDWQEGLESWSHILPSLLGGKESPLYKSVAGGLNTMFALVQENAPAAFEKAGEMAGDAWGWMTEIFNDIGAVFKGFFDGIMGWIDDTIVAGQNAIIDIANKIPGVNIDRVESKRDKGPTISESATAAGFMDTPAFKNLSSLQQNKWMKANGFINDGTITKDGRVTRFDNKDDILAAKRGGPIDKLLDQNSTEMKTIANINAQQLNVLVEIRDSNAQIRDSLKSGGNLTFSNASLAQEFFE